MAAAFEKIYRCHYFAVLEANQEPRFEDLSVQLTRKRKYSFSEHLIIQNNSPWIRSIV
jgi:hypothetical protein